MLNANNTNQLKPHIDSYRQTGLFTLAMPINQIKTYMLDWSQFVDVMVTKRLSILFSKVIEAILCKIYGKMQLNSVMVDDLKDYWVMI